MPTGISDPDSYENRYTSALVEAVIVEDNAMVNLLLEMGCNPNERVTRNKNNLPIDIAIRSNDGLEVLKTLVIYNAVPQRSTENSLKYSIAYWREVSFKFFAPIWSWVFNQGVYGFNNALFVPLGQFLQFL